MLSKAIAVLAAATLTSAATPMGFMPQSNTPLIVSYGGISALDGVNLPRDCKFSHGRDQRARST